MLRLSRQKRDKSSTRKFPVDVTEGSCKVKIYRGKERGYNVFWISYYEAGKRIRRRFPTFEKAESNAREIVTRLSNGQVDLLQLSGADKEEFIHARTALEGTGIPLHVAAKEYAQCLKISNGVSPLQVAEEVKKCREMLKGGSLIEAVKFYRKHKANILIPKTVSEVVNELVEAKKNIGRSKRYCDLLRTSLHRFAEAFPHEIASLTASEIERWLNSLPGGTRNRNNMRAQVVTLFVFARKHGHLPKDQLTEAEQIDKATIIPPSIETFTPAEMKSLLDALDEDILAFALLGGFAGIRHQEILRMDWNMIKQSQGIIDLPASITKNKRRRIIPILPNLKLWLGKIGNQTGDVCIWKRSQDRCRVTASKLGIAWKQNALRHSYASYRLASVKNENQVALEMGNSATVIRSNYDQVKTPQEAKQWWAIRSS